MRAMHKNKVKNTDESPSVLTAAELPVNGQAADGKAAEAPRPPKPPLWEFLAHPERDGDDSEVWLYRLQPIIDRKQGEHCICKRRGRFYRDDILKDFGSGLYEIYVNNARGKQLYRDKISFHNLDYPPKIDPHELVAGDPRNARYLEMFAKPAEKPGKETKGDTNEILNTVLTKTGSFDPRLAEMWERTAKERDDLSAALAAKNAPPDMLALLRGFKELIPAAPLSAPPAAASDKRELLEIISAMQGMQLEMLRTVKELSSSSERGLEAPRNHMAELEQILGFAQKLTSLRVGGGERNGWDIGLDYAREVGLPIAQQIATIVALRAGGAPAIPMGAPVSPAAPGAFNPYADPQAMREHVARTNVEAGATPQAPPQSPPPPFGAPPVPPSPQPGAPAAGAVDELTVLIRSYGGLILNALNTGLPGFEFAEGVERLVGTATVLSIANFGEESISRAMLAIPELALFGETRLQQFAHEFTHYEEFLSEAEQEDLAETETGAEPKRASHQRRPNA